MISESDQRLLEELLDGQLDPSEAQRLNRRMSGEPELAGQLAALRAARAVRQSVFAAIAPDPAMAQAFARRVVSASRRPAFQSRFGGQLRIGVGIAACIAMGFIAGWFGRGRGAAPVSTDTPAAVEKYVVQNRSTVAVADHNDAGLSAAPTMDVTGPYQVWLPGPDGRQVLVAKFDTIDEVNAFRDLIVREAHRQDSNIYSQPVASAARF